MLALGILPEGYIYPKEERPLRDLCRRREERWGREMGTLTYSERWGHSPIEE
jgi:hypothetical protein